VRSGPAKRLLVSVLACAGIAAPAWAIQLPSDFVVEDAAAGAGFDTPTALAFTPDGRIIVCEKSGLVWVVQNGAKLPTPMWDAHLEVNNIGDGGLVGVAVDPDFVHNHRVYFTYNVDPDSDGVDEPGPTFGRLTSFALGSPDSNHVDPATRKVLIGVTWADGIPCTHNVHTIDGIRWGTDGSMLVSVGEGSTFTIPDAGGNDPEEFLPGRTPIVQDLGAFRAASILSPSGKILRIDPATGRGYISNPYWSGNLNSVSSKIWLYGLRNPWRFSVRPGSGATDPALGRPGSLYIGDVGWSSYEELDVAPIGGMNFGWPCYEGTDQQYWYQIATPTRLSCSWPITAENPALPTPPARVYPHPRPGGGDLPGSVGNAIMGGAFYTGRAYPPQYHNRLFYADYGSEWIRTAVVDSLDEIVADSVFALDVGGAVDFASDPRNGDLYYIELYSNRVIRLRYTGNAGLDQFPIARASGSPLVGVAPFEVGFDASESEWADGTTPTISWNFGDGTGSGYSDDVHVYQRPGIYSAVLTLDDNTGGVSRDTLEVVALESGGMPGTPILDNFDRDDGPLGDDWIADNEGLTLNGGTLVVHDAVAGAVWSRAVAGPDQESYVSFVNDPLPGATYGLILKAQGDSPAGGAIEVRYRAGAGVTVGSTGRRLPYVASGDSIPADFVAGDLFGARAFANGIVQVFRNGALLGERSVTAWRYYRDGGRIGVKLSGSLGTRFDDFGGGDIVVQGDKPPVATLSAPLNNAFYVAGDTIHLAASATDDRDPPAALRYQWSVDVAHNNHIHPNVFTAAGTTAWYLAEDHDDGTGAHYVIRVRVTDTSGLSDAKRVDIYPEVDLEPTLLSVDPDLSTPGFDATVSFTILNHGRMLAPRSRWQMSFDSTVVAEGDTIVAPGGTVNISVPVGEQLDQGFPRRINATVDAFNAVHELTEANNQVGLPIRVVRRFGGAAALAVPRLALISPNPTRNGVVLALELPRPLSVRFAVYDLQGRVVWSAPTMTRPAGHSELAWGGRDASGGRAAPGLYFARVEIDGQRFIRRFAMLR